MLSPAAQKEKRKREDVKWWLPKDIGMYLLHMDGRPGQSPVHVPLEAPGSLSCFGQQMRPSQSCLNFRGFSGTVPECGRNSDMKQAVTSMSSLHRASVGPSLLKSFHKHQVQLGHCDR